MKAEDYIHATEALLLEGKNPDQVLANLRSLLEKKGHIRLYPNILRGLIIRLHSVGQTDMVKVLVAREKDVERHADAINALLRAQGQDTDYEIHTDATLIGGFAIEYGSNFIDNSYKKRLVSLYRSIIT